MKKALVYISILVLSMVASSCEPDEALFSPDLALIQKVKSTEILLRTNTWGFDDLIVDVKYEMRAIPLLVNVADADGMVQPGQYHSQDIFGNEDRQSNYTYQFATARIELDDSGNGNFDPLAYYQLQDGDRIKINPDSLGNVTYGYEYKEADELFIMTSDHLTNGTINEAINRSIANSILSGNPNDLANVVIDKILDNEEFQDTIEQLMFDLIHGKIDAIAENPEGISEKIAEVIFDKLKSVDWETLVYNKVLEILEELKIDDPEMVAGELAQMIADRIETNISQADIYDAILPFFERFDGEAFSKLVPAISQAIYEVIATVFSEENIYEEIYPLWVHFSEVDTSEVKLVSDSLGTVLTEHFFDAEELGALLEPFIATLRATNTPKIPALAQEIIDNTLIPLVDNLNATFPGLELDPDWEAIKPVLTSALTVLKSNIADQTNQEAALNLAENIIGVMNSVITKGVESAIYDIKAIPADQASQIIAAWINNLVDFAEADVVAFLENKLNELVDLINAEELAEELAAQIHARILETFGYENIYELIFPLIERISEININAAAEKIAEWLTDLDLIEDNISDEQLIEAIAGIISPIVGNIDVVGISQKITDAILQSDIVQAIDGAILKHLLELKIYEFLIELGKEVNSIEKIEVSIVKN